MITHSWNGTVLTVTSDSGTSSADLKGEMGVRGPQGIAGDIAGLVFGENYLTPKDIEYIGDQLNIGETILIDGYARGDGAHPTNKQCVDTTTGSGWYKVTTGLKVGWNEQSWTKGFLRVDGYSSQYCAQTLYVLGISNTILQRYMRDGSWSKWHTVRGNMTQDIEYLTPWLWMGQPIYAIIKRVPYPKATTDGSYPTVTVDLPEGARPFFVTGRDAKRVLPFSQLDTHYIGLYGGYNEGTKKGYVTVRTRSVYGAQTATILALYTKEYVN